MNLPVEHYLRVWSNRRNSAQSKHLSNKKAEEIDILLSQLKKLSEGTLVESTLKDQRILFIIAATGALIGSLSFQNADD